MEKQNIYTPYRNGGGGKPYHNLENLDSKNLNITNSNQSIESKTEPPKISFLVTFHNQKQYVKENLESILNLYFSQDSIESKNLDTSPTAQHDGVKNTSLKIQYDKLKSSDKQTDSINVENLDSKKSQNFEILIGDDNSSDGTLEVIESYLQKYSNISLYKMPQISDKNPIHRASHNRLNLVKHAKGEYIVFLDGDDYLCDRFYIIKALNFFTNNPSIIASMFNFTYLNTDNTQTPNIIEHKEGIIESRFYVRYYWSHVGAFVFKNIHLKENLALLESSKNFDDNLITIFMLQFGDVYYCKDSVYVYRQSENSIWNEANETQRQLINMMDYEILTRVAPKFKKRLFFRQYAAIKYIFNHKKDLKSMLGDKYQGYLDENKALNNTIAYSLLNYQNLSLFGKFKINCWFYYKKLRRK